MPVKTDTKAALNGVMGLLNDEGYVCWGFAMRRDGDAIDFLTISNQPMSRSKTIELTRLAIDHISDHSIDSYVDNSLKSDEDDEPQIKLGEA